jgi:hypothetical protein
MVVFTDELLNLTMRTDIYSTLLWAFAALAVTLVWGPATLTRAPTPRPNRAE